MQRVVPVQQPMNRVAVPVPVPQQAFDPCRPVAAACRAGDQQCTGTPQEQKGEWEEEPMSSPEDQRRHGLGRWPIIEPRTIR